MQNDLHSRIDVLLLLYFHGTLEQHYTERLIGKSKRGGCTRESVEITNKPFFYACNDCGLEA